MMELSTLEPIGPSLSGVSTDTTGQGALPLSCGGTGGSLSPVAGATHYDVKDYHNG
jgi:hypothetical protein